MAERQELLSLCRGLGPGEWEAPSLCEGWRVRDVVAHIIGGDRELLWDYVRCGGNLDAATARSVDRRREVPVQQLLIDLADIAAVRGLARLFAGIGLVDNWIHQEDIRHPLGRLRPHDPERLRWVLRVARLSFAARVRGLRLVATDLDLTIGEGAEVRGPAADLIMGAAGRPRAARALEGPGAARLLA
jgi:uncharacterized protein (TIGR03083 family)